MQDLCIIYCKNLMELQQQNSQLIVLTQFSISVRKSKCRKNQFEKKVPCNIESLWKE